VCVRSFLVHVKAASAPISGLRHRATLPNHRPSCSDRQQESFVEYLCRFLAWDVYMHIPSSAASTQPRIRPALEDSLYWGPTPTRCALRAAITTARAATKNNASPVFNSETAGCWCYGSLASYRDSVLKRVTDRAKRQQTCPRHGTCRRG